MELWRLFFSFLSCRFFCLKISRIQDLCVLKRSDILSRLFCCRCLRCCRFCCRCLCLFFLSLKNIDKAQCTILLGRWFHLRVYFLLIDAACCCPRRFDISYDFLLWLVYYIAPVKSHPLLKRCLYRLFCFRIRCLSSESEICRFFFYLRYLEYFCYSSPA